MATQSNIYAAVAGYVGRPDQAGRVGVFRRSANGGEWQHALADLEAFTVVVHPRRPEVVFAGTADGHAPRATASLPAVAIAGATMNTPVHEPRPMSPQHWIM